MKKLSLLLCLVSFSSFAEIISQKDFCALNPIELRDAILKRTIPLLPEFYQFFGGERGYEVQEEKTGDIYAFDSVILNTGMLHATIYKMPAHYRVIDWRNNHTPCIGDSTPTDYPFTVCNTEKFVNESRKFLCKIR